jgi:hypothetical protein
MLLQLGKCHICKEMAVIKYCSICEHWFCPICRTAYFKRGIEAIKEMLNGASPNCCGVTKEVEIELPNPS